MKYFKYTRVSVTSFLFALAVISLLRSAYAQNPVLLHTVTNKRIDQVSIDRKNNIYITDRQGNIESISEAGDPLTIYSPSLPARVHLIESWQGMKTFVFYKDRQEFLLLDRFLNPTGTEKLERNVIGFARLAAIANDNNIWIIDDSDFSLKKYHLHTRNTSIINLLNTILPEDNYDFVFMKEYQNQLFIADPGKGIFIFDNLGNFIKSIPVRNVHQFNFINDELYFIEKNTLYMIHLYTSVQKEVRFPENNYKFVLLTSDKAYLFTEKDIFIFRR